MTVVPREEWQRLLRAQNEYAAGFIAATSAEIAADRQASASRPHAPEEGGRDGGGDDAHRFAKDQLKAFVERVERLQEEKKAIADDIADVYREAKGAGFVVKALREVVRMRGQDVNERKEHEAIVETYLHALGMLG